MFAFWRRSFGVSFVVALAAVALGLAFLVAQGASGWFVGALGTMLVVVLTFAAAVYGAHYRRSLRKFREMGSPQATFSTNDSSFTFSPDMGTTTLQWPAVKALWRFQDVWLLLYSEAQFSTLPLACLPSHMQAFVVQRIQAAGGKVCG